MPTGSLWSRSRRPGVELHVEEVARTEAEIEALVDHVSPRRRLPVKPRDHRPQHWQQHTAQRGRYLRRAILADGHFCPARALRACRSRLAGDGSRADGVQQPRQLRRAADYGRRFQRLGVHRRVRSLDGQLPPIPDGRALRLPSRAGLWLERLGVVPFVAVARVEHRPHVVRLLAGRRRVDGQRFDHDSFESGLLHGAAVVVRHQPTAWATTTTMSAWVSVNQARPPAIDAALS